MITTKKINYKFKVHRLQQVVVMLVFQFETVLFKENLLFQQQKVNLKKPIIIYKPNNSIQTDLFKKKYHNIIINKIKKCFLMIIRFQTTNLQANSVTIS